MRFEASCGVRQSCGLRQSCLYAYNSCRDTGSKTVLRTLNLLTSYWQLKEVQPISNIIDGGAVSTVLPTLCTDSAASLQDSALSWVGGGGGIQ